MLYSVQQRTGATLGEFTCIQLSCYANDYATSLHAFPTAFAKFL